MASDINLFKTIYAENDVAVPFETEIKKLVLSVFIIVLSVSAICIGVYIISSSTLNSVKNTNTNLVNQLNDMKNIESLLVVIKSRIGIVEKVVNSSKPMGNLLNYAYNIAAPPSLTSLNQNDQGVVSVSYKAGSLEDCVNMVINIINMYNDSLIKNIMINSLSLGKDGYSIVFSFNPVW